MNLYMRKDGEVQAIVWNTANIKQIRKFVGSKVKLEVLDDESLRIWNVYRDITVPAGYYLIRTTQRIPKYSVMSMDDFDETYDKMYEMIVK